MRGLATLCAVLLATPLAFGDALERPAVDEAALEDHIATLRREAKERLEAQQARLLEVGFRLRSSSASLCGDERAPLLGVAISRRRDHIWGYEEEAEQAFGAVDEVRIFAIAGGSPAESADLRVGDLILAVDGSETAKTADVFEALRDSRTGPPTLRVRRGDTELEIPVPRLEGCEHGLMLLVHGSPDTVSHQNKHEILATTGLLDFVRDDDELAIAVAHQIGHQVLGSTTPKDARGEEPPADVLGLRIAERAGYDVSKAAAYWDRLAAEEPWRIAFDVGDSTTGRLYHVGMPARAPAIRSTVAEIQDGDALPEPLAP